MSFFTEVSIANETTRVNDSIRISPVRLIGDDGTQHGIVPLERARAIAADQGLDLVEVAPGARPPVVKAMDWGKFQFEQQKRARESKKRQHTVDVKEIKLRPGTHDHDFQFKLRNTERFLKDGKKVKITVRFRGPELRRPERGRDVLESVAEAVDEIAVVESRSRHVEGRQLTMMLAPR
jgi:translation initiation factor IF-3